VDITLKEGIERTEELIVKEEVLATNLGSGTVGVYATPAMIALMESVSWKLVQPFLPEGYTTVGTEVHVKHLKATPPDMRVRCRSRLTAVEEKRLFFEVEATDERGRIGEGTHTRYIVEKKQFEKKAVKG
jgi:fluoroacetyl-CoA thioesterase